MRTHFLKRFFLSTCLGGVLLTATTSRAQETEVVTASKLGGVKTPQGTLKIKDANIPDEISSALKTLIEGSGGNVRQGASEVLAWTGGNFKKSRIPQIKTQVGKELTDAGWTYTEGEPDPAFGPFSLVTAVRTVPTRKALVGFWIPSDDSLMLAWTEMLPASTPAANSTPAPSTPVEKPQSTPAPATPTATGTSASTPAGATVIEVGVNQRSVNLMKSAMPPIPKFESLAVKPGFVRGYVKDWKGKPLAGAIIGVRSTAVGGAYSGASAKSDAKGYYEIQAPFGVASFYAAGYTVDWGEGRAGLGLHPADGEIEQFATNKGIVENWVLLPYGIADRDRISENPSYYGNYYGGTFSVYYWSSEDEGDANALPVGGEIEMTLAPDGPLFDGSKGQTFVLRRRVDEVAITFYVNNIPLGRYKISARLLRNGKAEPIRIKETGPYMNASFGLEPKETRGAATMLLRPGGAKAETTLPKHGNWNSLDLSLYR